MSMAVHQDTPAAPARRTRPRAAAFRPAAEAKSTSAAVGPIPPSRKEAVVALRAAERAAQAAKTPDDVFGLLKRVEAMGALGSNFFPVEDRGNALFDRYCRLHTRVHTLALRLPAPYAPETRARVLGHLLRDEGGRLCELNQKLLARIAREARQEARPASDDAALFQTCGEYATAFAAAREAFDENVPEEEWKVRIEHEDTVLRRVQAIPATTLAGLKAKVRAISLYRDLMLSDAKVQDWTDQLVGGVFADLLRLTEGRAAGEDHDWVARLLTGDPKVKAIWEIVSTKDPRHVEAWMRMGRAVADGEDFATAERRFKDEIAALDAEEQPRPLRRVEIDGSDSLPPTSDVELTPAELEAAWAADPSTAPDAGLIRDCARYLELERILADPMRPQAMQDCDLAAEWPEFSAVQEAVLAAEPQTRAGASAMARVALLCSRGDHLDQWTDDDAGRLARKLLLQLAGPGIQADFATLRREKDEARVIITARYADKAPAPPQPKPEPLRDTRSPETKIRMAREMISFAENVIREGEAELAAQAQAGAEATAEEAAA